MVKNKQKKLRISDSKDLERKIFEAFSINNLKIEPIFVDKMIHLNVSEYSYNQKNLSNKLLTNSFFSSFKNGIIIPFDYEKIPQEDFVNQRGIGDEYQKYIARPDFLYVSLIGGNAHIFPIDVKTGRGENRGISKVNQISMMNLAMLHFHSKYMRKIVDYLKKENEEVIFENGFFLFGETPLSYQNSLDDYIKNNLSNSVKKIDKTRERLGVKIINGRPSMKFAKGNYFDSEIDFNFKLISEPELINHFSFVKNRFGNKITYPNVIISINGFNGGRRPVYRFDFNPTSHIRSSNPMIEMIEREIADLVELGDDNIFEYSSVLEGYSDKRKLKKLELELESKKIGRDYLIENRCDALSSEDIRDRYAKARHDRFVKKLQIVDLEITDKEEKFRTLRNSVIIRENREYLSRLKVGSREWKTETLKIRKGLVAKLEFEHTELVKKKIIWDEEDSKNREIILNFYLKSFNGNPNFTLAVNPKYSLPIELYMQFNSKNVAKVLLYNSYVLKE